MAKHAYDPDTLPELIKYVRDRRAALQVSISTGRSYSGPDPSPERTARDAAAVETLTAVLQAVRDIEAKKAAARLTRELDLEE